jgi:hypothetical protein
MNRLSERTRAVLAADGVRTSSQLGRLSVRELKYMPGIGPVRLEEVCRIFKCTEPKNALGLSMRSHTRQEGASSEMAGVLLPH